ncbi:right-handed parallel beta-helix repeat-containing protein [Nocardioides mangrovi]|uniref:Right-handed parallel beta-helix repeat-containing protein n=1 Tax=Nocardioides mangrovi TaxID=2874580 RepID=A0ABS7UJN1_9ACTN|nr:right-handed parallel beta-helix repeat-containing protein [Nocardioides mangrovi]MBZ5740987.1 right-handed parallel beta-helix repeat-containing protein [Nocardioides mangrovi]
MIVLPRPRYAAAALAVAAALLPGTPAVAGGSGHGPDHGRPSGTYTIAVRPDGGRHAAGADRVVTTIEAARRLARAHAGHQDVVVSLAGGTYELAHRLRFTTADGGRNGHQVTWTSAPGQHAVLSGGTRVTGWRVDDAAQDIWVARVPRGTTTRQLYVDGGLAQRTRLQLAASKTRPDLEFTTEGLVVHDAALAAQIATLTNPQDLEVEELGSFTDRISPVVAVRGDTLVMEQPAWNNNNFGYDTLKSPYARGAVYLDNAYELLDEAGQWYLDSAAGRLYYRAAPGDTMAQHDVWLPRLESLVQVSGSYAHPVRDLSFTGLTFSHTTWRFPSSSQGYVDQQSGAHAVGTYDWPADFLTSCQNGCPEFEESRNEWAQIPGAVQVSAAQGITFSDDAFDQLGSVGLGIGMDADAHASGVGYGASRITVDHSSFTDSSGSAIVVGGVRPDAHHPTDPRMTDHDITITDNTVDGVSQDYRDNAGILSTYVTRATISHNTVTDLPYDGIDIGWGWGTNDPGGNEYYLEHGLYDYQPVYDTPTTFRDNTVSYNLIHDTKQSMNDGGSIYTLSASPGTVIERNYVYDNKKTFGALVDQGSRYLTIRDNVFVGCSNWLYVNSDAGDPDTFNTKDNLVTHNWWDVGPARNPEGDGYGNEVVDNTQVTDGSWPAEAQQVMAEAGARP